MALQWVELCRGCLDLMKFAQELLSILREFSMLLMVKATLLLIKCRSDHTPIGISCEENHQINVAVFPRILHYVVVSRCFNGFHLDSMIVWTIGYEDICLVPMIKYWKKYLPAILHEPAYNHAFK